MSYGLLFIVAILSVFFLLEKEKKIDLLTEQLRDAKDLASYNDNNWEQSKLVIDLRDTEIDQLYTKVHNLEMVELEKLSELEDLKYNHGKEIERLVEQHKEEKAMQEEIVRVLEERLSNCVETCDK